MMAMMRLLSSMMLRLVLRMGMMARVKQLQVVRSCKALEIICHSFSNVEPVQCHVSVAFAAGELPVEEDDDTVTPAEAAAGDAASDSDDDSSDGSTRGGGLVNYGSSSDEDSDSDEGDGDGGTAYQPTEPVMPSFPPVVYGAAVPP